MKKSKLPKGADDANDAALWQAVMGGRRRPWRTVCTLSHCSVCRVLVAARKRMLTMLSY